MAARCKAGPSPARRIQAISGADRELLCRAISRTRERVNRPPLVLGDLRDDMRSGAEPVDAKAPGVPGHRKRATADQPRAKKRCSLDVAIALGDRNATAFVCERMFRVSAIEVKASEARASAEILAPGPAEFACHASPAEPRHADPLAFVKASSFVAPGDHFADDLVPGNERQLRVGLLAVDDVEVGAADTAAAHSEHLLSRAPLGKLEHFALERVARRVNTRMYGAQDSRCMRWRNSLR